MVAVTEPLQCGLARDVDWDDVFLLSLWPAMRPPPDALKTLAQAIWLFNRANSDDQWQSAQQLQQEAVMSVQALEYLFGIKGQKLEEKVADCLATDGEMRCRPPRVDGSWMGGFNISNRRCVYYWLRDLIQLRNDTFHGQALKDREWAWAVDEHAVMAAFVFPLVVKCLLVHEGPYELTKADEIRLRAIDKLLCVDNWGPEQQDGQSNWSKVFQDVKNERGTERIPSDLCKAQAEGKPISPERGAT